MIEPVKDHIHKLAQESPAILLASMKAYLAALVIQHNALLLCANEELQHCIECGCKNCKPDIVDMIDSIRAVEADRVRIQAAMDLVMQIKSYHCPPKDVIKKAFDRTCVEFDRSRLEDTLEKS